jgi:hypothetical protein
MKTKIITLFLTMSSMAWAEGILQLQNKENVVVDGNLQEWANPLPNYDKKTGINYDLANDAKNLYVIIKVVNNSIQHQILSNGFELWINTDGVKKKTIGISYPLKTASVPHKGKDQQPIGTEFGNKPAESGSFAENNGETGRPDPKQFVVSKELILSGFKIKNGQQPTNECPVHTAISVDQSGCMIYELAIPFNTFYKDKLEKEKKNVVFYIGLLVKKSDLKIESPPGTEKASEASMGGGGQMGGGGMGGGMGGGGGPMGGGGQMNSMGGKSRGSFAENNNEKQYWFKIILAANN